MALSERAQQQRERVRQGLCPGCGSTDLREDSAWCIECESDLVHRYFSRLGQPCPEWACAHRGCPPTDANPTEPATDAEA